MPRRAVISRIPAGALADVQRQADMDLLVRITASSAIYPVLLFFLALTTPCRAEHPVLFWAATAGIGFSLALRFVLWAGRVRIYEHGRRWVLAPLFLSIVVSAGTLGLMHVAVLVYYGFSSWTFVVMVLWVIGITSGSTVSFTPNYSLLLTQIGLLLGPALAYDFFSGAEHGISYGIAILVCLGFHAFQGYRLHVMYWDLLADRAREVLRTHELESAQEMLRYRATHDQLTGLVNRGQILSVLEREIERANRSGAPLGVVMLDLDLFKEVNDEFGHLGGDEVLCGVAKRLQASIRPYDTVGRYGGEEFLIVLPGCDVEESAASAERIRTMIEGEPIALLKAQARVTASFGVSIYLAARDTNKRQMIGRADKALYLAKQRGRNRVEVYVPQPKVLTSATA